MRIGRLAVWAAVAAVVAGCAEEWERTGRLTLAERGKAPRYTIVLPADPSPSQVTAAKELGRYFAEMTGVTLPVATNAAPKRGIFLGSGADDLGHDGFRLRADPPHFRIEGGRVHGTLFGVYDFLERYCGCEWFAIDTSVIPKREAISVPAALDDLQKPAFELRDANWTDHLRDVGFAARLKMNGFRIEYPEELGGRDHRKDTTTGGATMDVLCPPGKYFKDHPEWFALVNGRRKGERSQRCMTDPGFLDFLERNVLERIRKNYPACKYYSIYQNDWKFSCGCETCKAIDDREGTPMGSVLSMANEIAARVSRKYPDVKILTFSYMYTLKPPKTLRPHRNVMVCYCTDACDFSKPFVDSKWKGSKAFVEDFREWRRICDSLYIWDYSANFQYLDMPFECVHVLQKNFQLFRDTGVFGVFEEGDHYRTHGTDEQLKTWMIAHLLWNPDQPVEPLLDRFFRGYYGPAAETARAYYDALVELERKRDESKQPLGMWGVLDDPYLPVAFFDEWSDRWSAALEAVGDRAPYRDHVYWTLHRIDCVRLRRSPFRKKVVLSRDPAKAFAGMGKMIETAKRLKRDADGEPECIEFRSDRREREFRFVTDFLANDPRKVPAADKAIVEDSAFSPDRNYGGSRVKDAKAADGSAIRIDPSAPGWNHSLRIAASDIYSDPGVPLKIRIRARVEKTGVDGEAFNCGTCNIVTFKERQIHSFEVKTQDIPDGEYHWYDVRGQWQPKSGEVLWIGMGRYDGKKNAANPAVRAVFIDQVELRRAD